MHKLMLVAFVVLGTVQFFSRTDAFIIKNVSIQKGLPASLPSPQAAIGALTSNKNALFQSVTNAVTEKINNIKSLVGSLVQSKIDAKTNILRMVTNASGGIVKNVNGILASKPVFTKTITFGYRPPSATTTTQAVPTTTGALPTTTGQSTGGSVKYVRSNY